MAWDNGGEAKHLSKRVFRAAHNAAKPVFLLPIPDRGASMPQDPHAAVTRAWAERADAIRRIFWVASAGRLAESQNPCIPSRMGTRPVPPLPFDELHIKLSPDFQWSTDASASPVTAIPFDGDEAGLDDPEDEACG